jgi:hypothetical protein
MASLADVMHALGKVQATVDAVAADLADEKVSAKESRSTIHKRLDDQSAVISGILTSIALSAQADAQARLDLAELTKAVASDRAITAPSLADWERMKRAGLTVVGLLALGGLSIAGMLVWAGDAAVAAVRHWLHIP